MGWVTRDTVQRYTQNINEEKALYQKSPVHQSAVGQVTEFGTEGFYTAGGAYVLGKVIPAIKNNEMLKLYATKVWQSSKEFVSHNKFRSPLTFQYDANRLYSGFPN